MNESHLVLISTVGLVNKIDPIYISQPELAKSIANSGLGNVREHEGDVDAKLLVNNVR